MMTADIPTLGYQQIREALLAAASTQVRQSWKWQLRDRKGQWIEMNSPVSWVTKGKEHRGQIVGSTGPGTVAVRDENGIEHHLPSNRVTVTGKAANAPGKNDSGEMNRPHKKQRGGSREREPIIEGEAPTKAPSGDQREQKAKLKKKTMPKSLQKPLREAADIIRDNVAPENRDAAIEASVEVAVGRVAEKLEEELDDPKVSKLLKPIIARGLKAVDKIDEFIANHEVAGKLIEKMMMWADEFISAKLGGSTSNPGLGGAFESLGFVNPFVNPIGFVTEAATMLHGTLEALLPVIHHILGSGGRTPGRATGEFEDRLLAAASTDQTLGLLRKDYDEYGLTDRQISLALKILDRLDAQQAAQEARIASGVRVPTGLQTIMGEVVSVRTKETPSGERLAMLVEAPDGWRVWGVVPKVLSGITAGGHVHFDANIRVSEKDPTLGFFDVRGV